MSNMLNTLFHNTSTALRAKGGTLGGIRPADYPTSIANLPGGSGLNLVNAKEIPYVGGSDYRDKYSSIPAGMFVELTPGGTKEIYLNELFGSTVDPYDTTIISSNTNSSLLASLINDNENNEIILALFESSATGLHLLTRYIYTPSEDDYYPVRVVKLTDNVVAVISLRWGEDDDDDNYVNVKIFQVYIDSEDPSFVEWDNLYDNNISVKTYSYGWLYNNFCTYSVTVQHFENEDPQQEYYLLEIMYTSTGEQQQGDEQLLVLSVAVNGLFEDSSIINHINLQMVGSTTPVKNVHPFNAVDAGNHRTIWAVVDENGIINIAGLNHNGSTLKSQSNISEFQTENNARIVRFGNVYFLLYTYDEYTIYYSKLTITNTYRTGCGVTYGEGTFLYNSVEDPISQNWDISDPTYLDNKAVLSYRDANGKLFYANLEYDEDNDELSVVSVSPYGYASMNSMNTINYQEDGSLTFISSQVIEYNWVPVASICTIDSSGVHGDASTIMIANPAVETIDGITKTAASVGGLGVCYVLDKLSYAYDLDFNSIATYPEERAASITNAFSFDNMVSFFTSIDPEIYISVCQYMEDNDLTQNANKCIIEGTYLTYEAICTYYTSMGMEFNSDEHGHWRVNIATNTQTGEHSVMVYDLNGNAN